MIADDRRIRTPPVIGERTKEALAELDQASGVRLGTLRYEPTIPEHRIMKGPRPPALRGPGQPFEQMKRTYAELGDAAAVRRLLLREDLLDT